MTSSQRRFAFQAAALPKIAAAPRGLIRRPPASEDAGVPRRHYTPELATKSLPLVRRIVQDVQALTRELEALRHPVGEDGEHERETELAPLVERWRALTAELDALGVELKDPRTGLCDFRALRDGQEVYLCWRLGEASVAHWHTLDSGLAGREPIATF
jgi:hypothetical protein